MNDPILIPNPPHAHVRCLREGCGWYVAGDLDGAIADLEQHMVSMHDLDPARTRTQPRFVPDWHVKAIHDRGGVPVSPDEADRLVATEAFLPAFSTGTGWDVVCDDEAGTVKVFEGGRQEWHYQFPVVDRPCTAVTVVHPNDEVNAVLELLEEHPNMGLDDTRDGLDLAAIAARRWRRALKEQAG